MSEKEQFIAELSRYKEVLRVDASFDVVARVFMVSDKQAALFFVDGMIKDETMQKAFCGGVDIHTATASQVFGVPVESVTALQRRHAKAVNFGIVYGISEFSLAEDIGVSRYEAREYIDNYLTNYQGVRKYMKQVVEDAKAIGYTETLYGRKRYIPELKSSNFNIRQGAERIALNTPIQGTAADIIKLAMLAVARDERLRELDEEELTACSCRQHRRQCRALDPLDAADKKRTAGNSRTCASGSDESIRFFIFDHIHPVNDRRIFLFLNRTNGGFRHFDDFRREFQRKTRVFMVKGHDRFFISDQCDLNIIHFFEGKVCAFDDGFGGIISAHGIENYFNHIEPAFFVVFKIISQNCPKSNSFVKSAKNLA